MGGVAGDSVEEEEAAAEAAAAIASSAAAAFAPTTMSALTRVNLDHGGSYVGFLSPPGVSPGDSPMLDMLTEAAPALPAIIAELAAMAPATFIVSWNDHFFVMRFVYETKGAGPPGWDPVQDEEEEGGGGQQEGDAEKELIVYVMDSLGERLCEGCKRGYILRFDGASDRSLHLRELGSSSGGSSGGSDGGGGRGDAAAAAARFIGEVLPSRMLRHVSADIAASAAPGGPELHPETLMRRLQIEFHRVKAA